MKRELSVDILDPGSYDDWDSLAETSSQHCLFSTSKWLRSLTDASGEPFQVVACRLGKALVGGASFHLRKIGWLEVARTHPLTPFGGLVLSSLGDNGRALNEQMTHEVASAISGFLWKYPQVRLIHTPELVDVRPFQWDNWQTAPRFTYMIDVRDPDQAAARLGKSMRRQASKAESAGYTVASSNADLDLRDFANCYEDVYVRQGLAPPMAADAVVRWCARLGREGLGALYCARDRDGAYACGTLVVWDRRRAYWLLGATDRSRRGSGSNALLHLVMLRDLGRRFDEIDVVGANTPHVSRFKQAYHGTLTPYYVTERTRSVAIRAGNSCRSALTRLRARFRQLRS